MTRRTRRAAGLLLVLGLLGGCTPEETEPPAPAPASAPELSLVAEAPIGGPSEHAPPFAISAAVDLSPAAPESASTSVSATAAVAGPDGTVFVLLTSPDPPTRFALVTVGPRDGGLGVLASVSLPRMRQVWGMHLLPDGEVAVGGWFQPAERGFGFTLVDPVSGYVRTFPVIPFEDGTSTAGGHTALSLDGTVLYLFVGTTVGFRATDLLFAVDAATGQFRAGHDLFDELRGLSERGIGRTAAGLVPRRAGGVTLAFAGLPPDEHTDVAVPMLLAYGPDLLPVSARVSVEAGQLAVTPAAAGGGRGTVFVVVSGRGRDWLLAAPDTDGPADPGLTLIPRGFAFRFVVDPGERWIALPGLDGVRAVDLATGDARSVPVGCARGYPARYLAPGPDGTVLALGACADGQDRIPMLWVLGS
jgi:hypothetical protein